MAGFEGSAHDSRVLEKAMSEDFNIPDGYYFLADAGYGLSRKILTPYRGVRYHIREWQAAPMRHELTLFCAMI